jgi:hypothetical protein
MNHQHISKGETITFQVRQYSNHATMVYYHVGQHECTTMDKALVDRGANGGLCGEDTLVVEGSERFVDVVAWQDIEKISYVK